MDGPVRVNIPDTPEAVAPTAEEALGSSDVAQAPDDVDLFSSYRFDARPPTFWKRCCSALPAYSRRSSACSIFPWAPATTAAWLIGRHAWKRSDRNREDRVNSERFGSSPEIPVNAGSGRDVTSAAPAAEVLPKRRRRRSRVAGAGARGMSVEDRSKRRSTGAAGSLSRKRNERSEASCQVDVTPVRKWTSRTNGRPWCRKWSSPLPSKFRDAAPPRR